MHPGAADGDIVDIEAEPVDHGEAPRLEHDFVARLSEDQRFLQAFLRALARGDGVCGSQQRHGGGQCERGDRQTDHGSLSLFFAA